MAAMLSIIQARQKLLEGLPRPELARHSVPLSQACGRVLAETLNASVALPPADNSAMDGYAIRATEAGEALRVSQRIPAGTVGTALPPGCAARIFTGAPIPEGADAVVMQEDCQREGETLRVNVEVSPGQHIRRAGEDIAAGELVLAAGRRLTPADVGLAAAVGVPVLPVFDSLRVAIFSTGSELVEPGAGSLPPGAIYNSNTSLLGAILRALGCEVIDLGAVADDAEKVDAVMLEAATIADCVVSSGGVSVGEADLLREALERHGSLDFWRVAIKPGKPVAVGLLAGQPFFGLPGNPASVYVTACLLLAPWLRAAQGRPETDLMPPLMPVVVDFAVPEAGRREEYLRVQVESEGRSLMARLAGGQGSGVLSTFSRANALLKLPPGATLAPGDSAGVYWLDQLLR